MYTSSLCSGQNRKSTRLDFTSAMYKRSNNSIMSNEIHGALRTHHKGSPLQICPKIAFNKRHKVSPCSSPQLQHHSCLGIQTNAAPKVSINNYIYPELKTTLTFILTFLLEIRRKDFDLKRHLVMDVKIGRVPTYTKHLMTGPEGNRSFCFPGISMFPRGEAEGNIAIRGKQNELFLEGPVMK